MTEDAPILCRVGDENSYKILKLDKNEVSIGSPEDATYTISSQELSQCLIVIRRHGDTWTVTDIVSSNGICVNGHHLVPLSSYSLQDGDVVQFGAPTSSRGQRKFEYKFCYSFTVGNLIHYRSANFTQKAFSRYRPISLISTLAGNISQNKRMRELEEKNKELEQQLQKHNLAIEKVQILLRSKVKPILQSNKIKELELKNKELEQQLQNQNLAMEMILQDRRRERASLLEEINESHKESTEAKRQALQVKDDVLSNFTELMDVTVQCSICTEYFIKATSLNCSHVFCNLCINEWMKIKKLCPNCRTPVTSMTKIPALDKCIDRMVEQFSDDFRGRRHELINQRKGNSSNKQVRDCTKGSSVNQNNSTDRGRGLYKGKTTHDHKNICWFSSSSKGASTYKGNSNNEVKGTD
ncbi:unnamed protein product [Candidula unifasciata]|uniref:E3 ubiquitin-protein ligase CHFR n=1 Tax=Candidula unifasciata TaxID=100452 RepID=A0A8S3ZJP0_9EUPU|nr:unnamed protein product [Candidula unifasciata]